MAPFFIDIEGFQHGQGKFKIKELCIVDADYPLEPLYFLFKPNKPWQDLTDAQRTTYSYETRHLHHITWSEGRDPPFCRQCVWQGVKNHLRLYENAIFYVLGSQKLRVLQTHFPKLRLCEYNATLKTLPNTPNHIGCVGGRMHDKEHCACLKCYRLYLHYLI